MDLPPLREILEHHYADTLKAYASLCQIHPPPTKKADARKALLKVLLDPASLRALFDQLDPTQKKAVQEGTYAPHHMLHLSRFEAKYGERPLFFFPFDLPPHTPEHLVPYVIATHSKPTLLRLFFSPFVFTALYAQEYFLPSDLAAIFATFLPPPPPDTLRTRPELPASSRLFLRSYASSHHTYQATETPHTYPLLLHPSETIALREVLIVLRFLDAGKATISEHTSRPPLSTLRSLAALLLGDGKASDSDLRLIRASGWLSLFASSSLAHSSGNKLLLSPLGKRYLSQPPHHALRPLFVSWRSSKTDELLRIEEIKGQQQKRILLPPASRRRPLLDVLEQLPPQQWLPFSELLRFLTSTFPPFFYFYSRSSTSPLAAPLHVAIHPFQSHLLQDPYFRVCLLEFLATLGVVEIATLDLPSSNSPLENPNLFTTRYDILSFFRLTNLGSWLLGLSDSYSPPSDFQERHPLRLLPNLQIVSTRPLPPHDAAFLDSFALRSSELVWTLDPKTILEACEGGGKLTDFLSFLRHHIPDEWPSNVSAFFRDLERKHSLCYLLFPALILQIDDPAIAATLAFHKDLKAHCILHQNLLIVPHSSEKTLRKVMQKEALLLNLTPPPKPTSSAPNASPRPSPPAPTSPSPSHAPSPPMASPPSKKKAAAPPASAPPSLASVPPSLASAPLPPSQAAKPPDSASATKKQAAAPPDSASATKKQAAAPPDFASATKKQAAAPPAFGTETSQPAPEPTDIAADKAKKTLRRAGLILKPTESSLDSPKKTRGRSGKP